MKKIFAKIHLWLSLPFGIIIAIVCLSGAILVFEDEILELCYPSRYFVEEVRETPLSPVELISSARKQLPDSIKINGLLVTSDPQRTYQLVLPGKKATAFVDPYTAEIKGIDNGQGFFMQMMRLHRWLLDSYKRDGTFSWGKAIVGYATLVLVIITISGLIIWIPRTKTALKNRLKIKVTSGWRRFFYDLHVSGGFYSVLLLLVLSLTGLTWSFGWYRDTFYAAFGVQQMQPQSTDKMKPKEKGNNNKEGNSERDKKKKQDTDYTLWADILSDLQNNYTTYNSITIQDGSATVSYAQYGNTRGGDRYLFDTKTGEITEVQLYKDLPKSEKIRGWIFSAHVGSWGGMTTRILSCLVSFLGAVFAITGYYFWIKKSFKKKNRKKQKA